METSRNSARSGRLLILDKDHRLHDHVRELCMDKQSQAVSVGSEREALQMLVSGTYDVFVICVSQLTENTVEMVRTVSNLAPWVQPLVVADGTDIGHDPVPCPCPLVQVADPGFSPAQFASLIQESVFGLYCRSDDTGSQHGCQWLLHAFIEGLQATVDRVTLPDRIGAALTYMAPFLRLQLGAILDWSQEYCSIQILKSATTENESLAEQMRQMLISRGRTLGGDDVDFSNLELSVDDAPGFAGIEPGETPADMLFVPCFDGERICGVVGLCAAAKLTPDALFLIHQLPVHIGELGAVVDRIRSQAMYDWLTGLLNRQYLESFLDKTLDISRRYRRMFSVILLDLDLFKMINDQYGHRVGDRVLKDMAAVLSKEVRRSDVAGRYGGEEFCIVLPHTGSRGARIFTARLLDAVREHVFCSTSHPLRITASAGVTTFDPTGADAASLQANDLVTQADSALYAAKDRGRNRAVTWPGLSEFAFPAKPEAGSVTPVVKTDENLVHPSEKLRILLVDDEESIRRFLVRLLSKVGYDVVEAGSGVEAIERFEEADKPFDVLLTDLYMPRMGGLELIRRMAAISPTTPVIVMTGAATVDNAVESVKSGVFAFLEKPVRSNDLLDVFRRVEMQGRQRKLDAAYQQKLQTTVDEQERELELTVEKVQESYQFTLEAMVNLLDARERDTSLHSLRVRELTRILGAALGLSGEDLAVLDQGALLHDIGKISISDTVLLKAGPLTDEEWSVMRQHPTIGYRILMRAPWLAPVADIVYSHHERFDGSGYPRGLAGADICLGARLFAIVDAYDTIRSPRVYKEAQTEAFAVQQIVDGSGTHFDPQLTRVFNSCIEEIANTWERHVAATIVQA